MIFIFWTAKWSTKVTLPWQSQAWTSLNQIRSTLFNKSSTLTVIQLHDKVVALEPNWQLDIKSYPKMYNGFGLRRNKNLQKCKIYNTFGLRYSTSLYLKYKKWLWAEFLKLVIKVLIFFRVLGKEFQSLVAETLKVLFPSDLQLKQGQMEFKLLWQPVCVWKSAFHLSRSYT